MLKRLLLAMVAYLTVGIGNRHLERSFLQKLHTE
jgi:hypothetical protein